VLAIEAKKHFWKTSLPGQAPRELGYGRGAGVGRALGDAIGLGDGVGLGVVVGVAVDVAVAVAVGVAVAVAVGVGVGVPPAGAWIATIIGEPVLKNPTVALTDCGG